MEYNQGLEGWVSAKEALVNGCHTLVFFQQMSHSVSVKLFFVDFSPEITVLDYKHKSGTVFI